MELECDDDLLERRISRALTEAVDCHLELPRARSNRRNAVRSSEPEIIVAMKRDAPI